MNASLGTLRKPIRTVLRWQLIATAALTLAGGILAGVDGALSAALGGAVSICAGWVSAVVASKGKAQSAGDVLIGALMAEGVKIGLIVILLWLVLATYDSVVAPAFFGSFIVTVLIFGMAFFVRELRLSNGSRQRLQRHGLHPAPSNLPHQAGGRGRLLGAECRLRGHRGAARRPRPRRDLWWIVRGATSGVPNRRQAFVELAFEFVDEQVKGIFHHGDRNRFVAPAALTVFVWVLLMNAMDFLPVDVDGVGARERVPRSRVPPGADRGRQHHFRARACRSGS